MILKTLKDEGVPQDLIYLAQAESGFHPLALSRVGARGMWQFMASRGSGYGLSRNWWVDDRQDPEKATRAAARHLKDLYKQFGDWYLAMAAYNSGPGNVQKAVQRTGYADFWELYKRNVLPAETKNYVPIILAITIMSKNPVQYGLDRLTPEHSVPVDRVKIGYPVDLRLVAECVDTSVSTLQELNPSLLRLTTPKDGDFELRLPAGTKDKFETAIAAIPQDMRVWWRYHKVTAGDTLSTIAHRYHVSSDAIARANGLDDEDSLLQQTKLVIPIAPNHRGEGETMAFAKAATRYTVRKGDTVASVADDFGVPVSNVRKWNRLRAGQALKPGRTLLIHKPVAGPDVTETQTASSRSRRRGHVQSVSAKRGKHARSASAEADDDPPTPRKKTAASRHTTPSHGKHTATAKKSVRHSGTHSASASKSSRKKTASSKHKKTQG
jgi:membrane-bound lytic murein transglycosylase D